MFSLMHCFVSLRVLCPMGPTVGVVMLLRVKVLDIHDLKGHLIKLTMKYNYILKEI